MSLLKSVRASHGAHKKCNSCRNGFNGTGGNGYQSCACPPEPIQKKMALFPLTFLRREAQTMKGCRPLDKNELSRLKTAFTGRMAVRNKALFFWA
jgi:hypothetical protein